MWRWREEENVFVEGMFGQKRCLLLAHEFVLRPLHGNGPSFSSLLLAASARAELGQKCAVECAKKANDNGGPEEGTAGNANGTVQHMFGILQLLVD